MNTRLKTHFLSLPGSYGSYIGGLPRELSRYWCALERNGTWYQHGFYILMGMMVKNPLRRPAISWMKKFSIKWIIQVMQTIRPTVFLGDDLGCCHLFLGGPGKWWSLENETSLSNYLVYGIQLDQAWTHLNEVVYLMFLRCRADAPATRAIVWLSLPAPVSCLDDVWDCLGWCLGLCFFLFSLQEVSWIMLDVDGSVIFILLICYRTVSLRPT